jgi:hypothetical protein
MNAAKSSHRPVFRILGLAALAVLALAAVDTRGQDKSNSEGWISLFNGKDLEGWTPKITGYPLGENYADTFRVEDGVLKVAYDKYSKFEGRYGHLFYKTPFSHYRLRIEYRFVGKQCPGGEGWAFRNSGVMIHGQPPESMRKDQDFPVSIEVQFLGGNGRNKRPTANVCTPGTNIVMGGKLITQHCTDSKAKTYHGDQWVTVEVEAHGNGVIKHIVEGETVIEYEKAQYDEKDADARRLIKDGEKMIGGGSLSLQAESHPIEFRKVEILPLKEFFQSRIIFQDLGVRPATGQEVKDQRHPDPMSLDTRLTEADVWVDRDSR